MNCSFKLNERKALELGALPVPMLAYSMAWTANPCAFKPRGRPMVAPILRFQHIESAAMDNGRATVSPRRCSDCNRRCGHARRCAGCSRLTTFEHELTRAPYSVPEHQRTILMEAGTLESSVREGSSDGAQNQITTTAQLPDNFNRFRMGSLNWGIWAGFLLATVMLVPTHIYLKKYDYRIDLLGIIFVLTVLFLVCFSVSMFHSKTREILLHRLHIEEETRAFPASSSPASRRRRYRRNVRFSSRYNQYPLRRVRSTPELHLTRLSSSSTGSPILMYPTNNTGAASTLAARCARNASMASRADPPPYDIAVLLPKPPMRRCETPPPSYEHIQ
ncbi:uncharacterized protein LOC108677230 [Hyalella azteca]|uniref:Uncharacterized protein LOC108677230 n=1 Tax=Hyalella azteca TaxID=294128 RepID=A0A8B7P4P2_HYAAZ|nr:uncharacterized protein LOC108677230 [Hyalella azteca]